MKILPIEEALKWAFREELPKAARETTGSQGFAAFSWNSFAELLTRVDVNRYGVVPNFVDTTPHPDAVALGEAAMRCDRLELGVPDDWNPIADWGDLGAYGRAAVAKALDVETLVDASGLRKFKAKPSQLVVRYAVLGDRGEWDGEPPVLKALCHDNGAPRWYVRETVWVDDAWREVERSGFDEKRRRPKPDAYKKYFLDPDPGLTIFARARYEVWRAALDCIAEDVGELQSMRVRRSALPERPWEANGPAQKVWFGKGGSDFQNFS